MSAAALHELCRSVAQTGLVLLLQTGLILLLGLGVGWALRRRGPQAQSLAYRATLLAVLLVALISPALVHGRRALWRVSLPPAAPAPSAALAVVETAPAPGPGPVAVPALRMPTLSTTGDIGPVDAPPVRSVTPPVHAAGVHATQAICPLAAGLWLAGTLALLAWLGLGQASLRTIQRRGAAVDGEAAALLTRLCAARGLTTPRLLASPRVVSPFLAGLWRPAIFLPASYAQDFDADALRAILAHELGHLERRDNLWMLLARLTCVLFWPQPLLWALTRRMEQTAEEACDELALAQGCSPRAYADCLLSLAERLAPTRLERSMGTSVVPFRSQVGRRVRQVLGARRLPVLPPRLRVVIAAGAVCAAIAGPLLVSAADAPRGGQDVVRQYLAALSAGRYPEAYSLLSPTTQRYISRSDFEARRQSVNGSRPPTDPRNPNTMMRAMSTFFNDAHNTEGYRFELVGSAPDDPNAVLVRALPPGAADKDALTLRVVTVPDPQPGHAPRLDLVQTLRPLQPNIAEILASKKERTLCASNLKQIGWAILQYTMDHNERLPHADRWVDEIMPYVKDPSIFHDPSAPASQPYSYAFNRNLSGASISRLGAPAETVAVFESAQGIKNASDTGQSLPRPERHTGGSNFVFADGHIKWLRDQAPSFSLAGGQAVPIRASLAPAQPSVPTIVGTWRGENEGDKTRTLTFRRDGTFIGAADSIHTRGTYRIVDDRIAVQMTRHQEASGKAHPSIPPFTGTFHFRLNGSALTLIQNNGLKHVLKRVTGAITEEAPAAPPTLAAVSPSTEADLLAGLTPVQGPGLIVTLRDSKMRIAGAPPSALPVPGAPTLIHDTDINQAVNELKAAGAEAIAVNDQRLAGMSPIRSAGPTVYVNNNPQTPPFVIRAIGDARALQAALNLPNGVADSLRHFDPAMISMQPSTLLTLPAYSGTAQPKYARPVGVSGSGPRARPSRDEAARAAALRDQLAVLLRERAIFQEQLTAARRQLAVAQRLVAAHPHAIPPTLLTVKGANHLSPRATLADKIKYIRAVHPHNQQLTRLLVEVATRDEWLSQVARRQTMLDVLDVQLRRLRARSGQH